MNAIFSEDAPGAREAVVLAARCMNLYEWELMSAEDLVSSIFLADGAVPDKTRLIRYYMGLLKDACADSSEYDRRERASQELWRFVYCMAYNSCPEKVEEIAQIAMLMVLENLQGCRCRDTFMEFVMWKVRAAATDQLRFDRHRTRMALVVTETQLEAPADPVRGEGEDVWEGIADESDQLDDIVSRNESSHKLVQAIMRLSNPKHKDVLLMDLGEGLSDNQIARRMGVKANHVRKLRFDARANLRRDSALAAFAREQFQS